MSVEIGRYGRIILPKKIREKYGLKEGFRCIIIEFMGQIILLPVKKYGNPTEALYGSVKLDKPIEEPKHVAREYVRKKLVEET